MKKENGFIKFLLVLIVIALAGIIMLFGYVMYNEFAGNGDVDFGNLQLIYPKIENQESDNRINNTKATTDTKINGSTVGTQVLNKNEYQNKYLYSQLGENGKIIYEKLYENKENLKTGTYTIQFGNAFYDILSQENGSDKLQEEYQTAIEAFTYDNPDVFYIDVTKMYINIETIQKIFSTKYNVYINSAKDPTYLLDGFTSKEQIDQCESQVIAVKNQILNQIAGKNDIEKMRYIHDYLVDTIEYDQKFVEKNIYNIYGALVSKTCVCEGYAKASQYLLNEAGLENIIITGTATNSDGKTENHAWNYVNIDEKWYAIDTTWDDPIIVGGGKLTNTIRYRYFLKGSSTMNKNHFISTKFTSSGQDFEFPKLSITDYNI
ncbi:MAG: transglutaminase domain-containing protein [Clostridia bacterium]